LEAVVQPWVQASVLEPVLEAVVQPWVQASVLEPVLEAVAEVVMTFF
jgi:hypothetical protein